MLYGSRKCFGTGQRFVDRRQAGLLARQNERRQDRLVSIAPEVGYDFNQRWSVGVALGFEYLKVKDGDSYNVFTASPYARYKYYNKGILSLFLDGGVGFACGDYEDSRPALHPD